MTVSREDLLDLYKHIRSKERNHRHNRELAYAYEYCADKVLDLMGEGLPIAKKYPQDTSFIDRSNAADDD